MINYLPLHEDFVENLSIFRCLIYLYEIGNQYMVSLLDPVVKASLITLNDKRKYYENGIINTISFYLLTTCLNWNLDIIKLKFSILF